jgi:diguanylate cyclase (GGDEF)-like protein
LERSLLAACEDWRKSQIVGDKRVAEFADDLRIRGLAEVARTLGRSAQLATMVEIAAEGAARTLRAASVSISRLEPGTGAIRTLINVGRLGPHERRWPENEIYRLDDFMRLQAVAGELRIWTISVDDLAADPQEVRLLRSLEKGSSMGAPLVVDGNLWGELYATREAGDQPFSSSDEAYTEALSAILSGAVSRAIHVDSLERLAFNDPLTGLANRRALDDAAVTAFDQIRSRSGRRVSVVTLDLNGLKSVNDEHGHAEGDRLLIQVASLLQQYFSPLHGSLVARVGGDEFTVLVPGHDVRRVASAAEEVCRQVCELSIGSGLACGIATTTDGGSETAKRLLIAADQAQYAAKREERTTPLPAAAPYGFDYCAAR